jgi:hypothetical protein
VNRDVWGSGSGSAWNLTVYKYFQWHKWHGLVGNCASLIRKLYHIVSALRHYDGPCRTGEISVGFCRWKFRVKIVHINLDPTRRSCEKCNYSGPSGRYRTCGHAIPVQRSNQLSYHNVNDLSSITRSMHAILQ